MSRNVFGWALALAIVAGGMPLTGAEDDAPKYTAKEVMQHAHKEKLLNKVLEGNASADEKAKLVELYTALAANKPKKGDADNWAALNTKLVAAATAAAEGKEGSLEALKAASNCMQCHKDHK